MTERTKEPAPSSRIRRPRAGEGIAVGIAFGVALGAAFDQLAIGIALGTALGAAFDGVSRTKHRTPS
jgi:hypothetical protein